MKLKIKNFFSNLKMTLKVQKGALNRVAVELFVKLLVVAGLLFGAAVSFGAIFSAAFGGQIVLGVALVLVAAWLLISSLSIVRHDYKKVVADAADVVIKRSNKAGYIARKKAEKASIKAQNQDAAARKVEEKYK